MLAVGLLTDLYFALSAFEPVDNELDWSLVVPRVSNWCKRRSKGEAVSDSQGMLSKKLDAMLKMLKLMVN
jgi:hypothetical protein